MASPSTNAEENTTIQPNLSARFHPNTTEFNVFANIIAWSAQEAGADCWAEVITRNASSISDDIQQVNFNWNVGFRIGMGYGMSHDQWDTQVYYTWFHTRGKDHASQQGAEVHSAFLGNFYVENSKGAGLSGPYYESASINWTIHFNMFDWELGRNFWTTKSLALRPFIGLKGGWIHQFINSQWNHPISPLTTPFNVGIENIKNNFWGIGPEVGINTKWVLHNEHNDVFSIFGDLSGAIMWGHWSFSDGYQNDIQQQVIVDLQPVNSGAYMVKAFAGLEWEITHKTNFQFSTKLGYEMQFWLDQLQFYSFTGGRQDNLLTLQGGTIAFCFAF